MAEIETDKSKGLPDRCTKCGKPIGEQEGYSHLSQYLCEECYIDVRMPRSRKTHWQYLGAIKTEYLQDPPEQGGKD